MAVLFSPWGNQQFTNGSSTIATGWKIYAYAAGSSTPLATYTDSTGAVAQTNPMIINALGFVTNGQIWLTSGLAYKLVLTDENDVVKKTEDNITGVSSTNSASQWDDPGLTPTYISTTSFSLAGDQTVDFHVTRRIKSTVTAGTVYGTIITSVYGALTTITLRMDTGQVLDSGLSQVSYGLISAVNDSMPRNLQPTSFRADNNGVNILGIDSGIAAQIQLSTERHDSNSEYASGVFTAKKAGPHRFYFQFGTANPTASTILRAFLYVNGAVVARGSMVLVGTSSESAAVYSEINLAVGDVVSTWVFHTRGSDEDVDGTVSITYFAGGYIGA